MFLYSFTSITQGSCRFHSEVKYSHVIKKKKRFLFILIGNRTEILYYFQCDKK